MSSTTTVVEAERLRIARELHDIVAYSFATINVQAGVAAHVVGERPDEAAKALGAIREISGEAARELRRVLGVMRHSVGDADARHRGIDDLPSLTATMTSAGLPTRVIVSGDRSSVPRGVDRTVYAIAREALTNALRHAGPARARVSITYQDDRLVLDVSDDGRGGPAKAGFGISGMRERARAVGGDLEAGPRPTGGFRVRASLPTGGEQ